VPGTTVRLLLLNVFGENTDFDAVADLVRSERADVVGLTELTPTMADAIAPALARYRARAAEPQTGFFGIGLYGTRKALRRPRIETFAEGARNAAVGILRLGGRRATLVVLHPPFPITPRGAEDRSSQLDAIADAVERGELGPRVAVCGDLNAPSWTATARRLVDAGLTDTTSGYRLEGTWPSFLPGPLRLPLDNCLIRGLTLVSRSTGESVGSDHLPLVFELALPRR
jgi:endonuclease/exonuclease/phosphatase (EEP) superfamily protein YafD